MLTQKISRTVAILPLIGLTACGGGSTTENTPVIPDDTSSTFLALPFATVGQQTVSVATLTGQTFSAKSTTAGWVNGDASSNSGSLDFTIVDANTIQMTQGSATWTFRNQGGSPVEAWVADSAAGDGPSTLTAVFGQGSSVPSGLQSIFFGSLTVPVQQAGSTTFAFDVSVIGGFETNPTEVAALSATANYQGLAQILTRTGSTLAADTGSILDGTFDIDVDFGGSNAVSGTLTGTADADFGGGTVEMTLAGTSIAAGENDFSTSLSVTGGTNTAITAFNNSTLQGTLYGVDAAEMGILVEGDAVVSGSTLPAAGFGLGQKQ